MLDFVKKLFFYSPILVLNVQRFFFFLIPPPQEPPSLPVAQLGAGLAQPLLAARSCRERGKDGPSLALRPFPSPLPSPWEIGFLQDMFIHCRLASDRFLGADALFSGYVLRTLFMLLQRAVESAHHLALQYGSWSSSA